MYRLGWDMGLAPVPGLGTGANSRVSAMYQTWGPRAVLALLPTAGKVAPSNDARGTPAAIY